MAMEDMMMTAVKMSAAVNVADMAIATQAMRVMVATQAMLATEALLATEAMEAMEAMEDMEAMEAMEAMMTAVKMSAAVNAVVTAMVDMVDMAIAMVDMDMEDTLMAEMTTDMATHITR